MLFPISAPCVGDGTALGARLLRAGSGYQQRPPRRGGHRTLFHQYLTSFSPFFSLHSGWVLGYCAGEAVSLPVLVTAQKVPFSCSAFSWELPPALGVGGIDGNGSLQQRLPSGALQFCLGGGCRTPLTQLLLPALNN